MLLTSAIWFVLAVSSTLATQVEEEQLMERISSAVADAVAQAANTTDAHALNNGLLNITWSALEQMKPQLEKLAKLTGNSTRLADGLAEKVIQEKAVNHALHGDDIRMRSLFGALFKVVLPFAKNVVLPNAFEVVPQLLKELKLNS